MLQRQRQQRRVARPQEPKMPWRLIEGDRKRIVKIIDTILEKTGDDLFEVEFRIHRSARSAKPPPRRNVERARRKKPGVFATIFLRRRSKRP